MFSFHEQKYTGDNCHAFSRGFKTHDDSSSLWRYCCQYVWSPHAWDNGQRNATSWKGCENLVFDYDQPIYSIDEMVKRLNHYRIGHLLGTTKSHNIEKNGIRCERYRLVIPLVRPITDPQIYSLAYDKALQYPTLRGADTACRDLARWYAPCTTVVSLMRGPGIPIPGIPEGVSDAQALELLSFFKPRRDRAKVTNLTEFKYKKLNRAARIICERGLQAGSRNRDLFVVSCDLARAGLGMGEMRQRLEGLLGISSSGLPEWEIEAVIKKAAKKAAS